MKRVLCAWLCLAYQNASVERDLRVLRVIRDTTLDQLGDLRYDSRARVMCSAIDAKLTERQQSISGELKAIAQHWISQKRRQTNPAGPKDLKEMQRQGPTCCKARVRWE